MGNHSSWYKENSRKIIILSFSEDYLKVKIFFIKSLSKFLTKSEKKINISESKGFIDYKLKYSKYNFWIWFLNYKNRHHWRHHYLGTQGVILIFSLKEDSHYYCKNLIYEVINILNDQNLTQIPFLIIFDKSNKFFDENDLYENLRKELNEGNYLYNIQSVNFNSEKNLEELYYGIDWLAEVMKSVE